MGVFTDIPRAHRELFDYYVGEGKYTITLHNDDDGVSLHYRPDSGVYHILIDGVYGRGYLIDGIRHVAVEAFGKNIKTNQIVHMLYPFYSFIDQEEQYVLDEIHMTFTIDCPFISGSHPARLSYFAMEIADEFISFFYDY